MRKRHPVASRGLQAGLSLVELIIGMVILAVIVAGILGIARGGRNQSKVVGEVQNYNAIMECARNMKSAGTYGASGTNLTASAVNRKCIPTTMAQSGATVTNQFGGAVTLTSTGIGLTVSTAAIPQEVCSGVVADISQSGAYSTSINGGAAIVGPVTTAQADTGCSTATNTIAWTVSN